uniref:Uncharacterized protein n=1 Tax=Daphnia galeata TaxID=27404 RepID=A0A8J2RPM4_9CRUS|nr:unnamed protein product [Daphnia galeata]
MEKNRYGEKALGKTPTLVILLDLSGRSEINFDLGMTDEAVFQPKVSTCQSRSRSTSTSPRRLRQSDVVGLKMKVAEYPAFTCSFCVENWCDLEMKVKTIAVRGHIVLWPVKKSQLRYRRFEYTIRSCTIRTRTYQRPSEETVAKLVAAAPCRSHGSSTSAGDPREVGTHKVEHYRAHLGRRATKRSRFDSSTSSKSSAGESLSSQGHSEVAAARVPLTWPHTAQFRRGV